MIVPMLSTTEWPSPTSRRGGESLGRQVEEQRGQLPNRLPSRIEGAFRHQQGEQPVQPLHMVEHIVESLDVLQGSGEFGFFQVRAPSCVTPATRPREPPLVH